MTEIASVRARVAATFADAAIQRALRFLRDREREILEDQISLTMVPAPPFGEEERGRRLAETFRSIGFSPTRDSLGNVIVNYDTAGPNPVIVGAHLDTVFPRDTKLQLRQDGRVVHLPGISDNGAGLVALLWVFRAARESGLRFHRPVLGVANVGEEGRGDLRGIRHLFETRPWGAGECEFIAVDGGGLRSITNQGLGSRRFLVRMSGPGGHSWADFGRPNPVHTMATAIHSFAAIERRPGTSFNVGTIRGGISVNAIPKEAVMEVDLRSTSADQLDRLHAHLKRCAADSAFSADLAFQMEAMGERPLGVTAATSDLVRVAMEATRLAGAEPQLKVGSTDANLPMSLGIPAIAVGAGGSAGSVHTTEEWFDPDSRDRGLQRLLGLIATLAGLERPAAPD